MADNDGSRRFALKGGKHDAHRNKKARAGFRLRVYPDKFPHVTFGKHGAEHPAEWADEVEYDGEVYGHPIEQNPSAPFLTYLREA